MCHVSRERVGKGKYHTNPCGEGIVLKTIFIFYFDVALGYQIKEERGVWGAVSRPMKLFRCVVDILDAFLLFFFGVWFGW